MNNRTVARQLFLNWLMELGKRLVDFASLRERSFFSWREPLSCEERLVSETNLLIPMWLFDFSKYHKVFHFFCKVSSPVELNFVRLNAVYSPPGLEVESILQAFVSVVQR